MKFPLTTLSFYKLNKTFFLVLTATLIIYAYGADAKNQKRKAVNLFQNSDFSQFTHDPKLPDYWNMLRTFTLVTNPFAHVYELAKNENPPVTGARVMKARGFKGIICRLGYPVGGKYAFSVYMKSDTPNPEKTNVTLVLNRKKVNFRVGTKWQRLSCVNNIRSPLRTEEEHKQAMIIFDNKTSFFIAAPQLVKGDKPLPWVSPEHTQTGRLQGNVPEIMPDIYSIKVPTATKNINTFLHGLPMTKLDQVSMGSPEDALSTEVSMAYDDKNIYIYFKCAANSFSNIVKSSPSHPTLSGNDLVEVFITDTAASYVMLVVDSSGKNFSRVGTKAMEVGAKYQTRIKANMWTAKMTIPLHIFKKNKHWRISFSRIYNLKGKGRVVLNWPLTKCRGAIGRFGTLLGINSKANTKTKITQAYLESVKHADTNFHYRFAGYNVALGDSIVVSITQNGKILFTKTQQAKNGQGTTPIPTKILNSALKRGQLSVVLKNAAGQEVCSQKKPVYLFFSSLARRNPEISSFPKFNYFTEKDKNASLFIEGKLRKFNSFDIRVSNTKDEIVFSKKIATVSGELHEICFPLENLPFGKYKIKVTAHKREGGVENAMSEVMEKLPFRPYMIRINHKMRCLADANGNFFPIRFLAYEPIYPEAYNLDPKKFTAFCVALKKFGFNMLEYSFFREKDAISRKHIRAAWNHGLRTLADPLFVRRRKLLQGNQLPPEMEKVARSLTGERGLSCLWIFHEPQDGPEISQMREFMKKVKAINPYLPLSGCWTTRGYDSNGEPIGSIDAADYFETDIYTPDITRFAGEINRCSQASIKVRKPFGVILMLCPWFHTHRSPSPEEIQNQVYQSLIAGCRSIDYFGLDRTWSKRVWKKTSECNIQIKDLSKILLDDNMEEIAKGKDNEINYAIWRRGEDVCVMVASCNSAHPRKFNLDISKLLSVAVKANGKTRFSGRTVKLKGGRLDETLPPKGSEVYMFRVK